MEDEEIVALLLSRDERGIDELGKKYGGRLLQLAERILPAPDAAECINDTYLAVWESIPPRSPQYLFAYTAKICRNLALNRVEWNQAAKRNAVFVELSEELGHTVPDLSDGISRQELAKAIADFLNRQTKEQREMFVRRYWYGETVKELAQEFCCRQGRVKSILFRLRKGLRKELEKEGIV
ncbi:MAG: sigma-70 family RNA polymerase sigma factor [Lachnospiraceae bacterium]|nr:sigma-70 family RNA polymerase sigma factor [Lachnospiraceae bacterium]